MTTERGRVAPLGYLLRKSAYEAYNGVLPLGLVGIIFSVLTVLPLPLLSGGPRWIWVLALFAVPAWAGAFAVTIPMAGGQRAAFRPFWTGVARFMGRSLVLTVLYLLIAGVTAVVWAFWRQTGGMIGISFAIFQFYAFGMFLCAQIYTLPLMVKHNLPVSRAMALSAKLFLAHPVYTLAVLLQLASLAVVLAVGTVALPLLFPGLAAVLVTNAALNLTGELPLRVTATAAAPTKQ